MTYAAAETGAVVRSKEILWQPGTATLDYTAGARYLWRASFSVLRKIGPLADADDTVPQARQADPSLDAILLQSGSQGPRKRWQRVKAGFRYAAGESLRYTVDLDTTFERYLGESVSAENREVLRREVHRFTDASGGSIVFREYRALADMAEFCSMANRIAEANGRSSDGLSESLLRERLEDLARNGRVRGYVLFIGREPVAYLWCHVSGKTLYRAQFGFDPGREDLSPDTVLQFVVLQRLFVEREFQAFDFNCAAGQDDARFATEQKNCADVYYFRWSIRNTLYVLAHLLLKIVSSWFEPRKPLQAAGARLAFSSKIEEPPGVERVSAIPEAAIAGAVLGKTRSVPKKLALGSGLRTANLVANALVGLLLTPFIVHSLGDRVYGLWALVGAILGYYGLMDLGLTAAASRYLAQAIGAGDPSRCNRVFNTALFAYKIMGLAAASITILLALGALLYSGQSGIGPVFAMVILFLGTSATIAIPLQAFTGSLNADLHFDITSSLELLTVGLRASSILGVLLLHRGIIAMAAVAALAPLPSAVINVIMLRRRLSYLRISGKYVDRSMLRELFSYGVVMSVSQIADALRFQVAPLFVSAYVGLAAVAHYNVANLLMHYYITINLAALGVFSSLFSQREGARDIEGLNRAFYFATKLSLWLASFIGFGLVAWGKPFITRWMGASYIDAYPLLVILTIGCIFSLGQMSSVRLMFATSKHRPYAIANCCEALANVVLSFILVRRYGMMGIALGTFFPIVVVKIFVQPVYFCRVCRIPYTEYVGRLVRTSGCILVALVAPAILAMRMLKPTYPSLVVVGSISAVLYVLAFLLVEVFSDERDMPLQGALPSLLRRLHRRLAVSLP